jgi:hypothetical protein
MTAKLGRIMAVAECSDARSGSHAHAHSRDRRLALKAHGWSKAD